MIKNFVAKNSTYLVSLIFRIYYVVFSISYPLLAVAHKLPIQALNVYAAVSVGTTVLSFFSFRAYSFSVINVRWLAIGVSLLNIVFFCSALQSNVVFCYVFAVAMGVAASSIDFSALSMATKNQNDTAALRGQLLVMNALKVTGIAFGFLVGCLVSSTEAIAHIGYYFVGIVATICIMLSASMRSALVEPEVFRNFSLRNLRESGGARFFLLGILLFAADLAVFGFWFTALPISLKNEGWNLGAIGLLLAAEAITHAISQKLWHRVAAKLGDLKVYAISISLHVGVLAIMLSADFLNLTMLGIAFVCLGVSNAGTYITSSTFYYSRSFGIGKFQMIAIHQISSNAGKLIGPFLAIHFMRF